MSSHSTRWTIIRGAAEGNREEQEEFARHYGPVIRAYLGARWRKTPLFDEVDDAAQQVFLDCFKEGGALGRADETREGGFRAFLFGIVRNVALMAERKRARTKEHQATSSLDLQAIASREDSCAAVFDKTWAGALLRDAAELHLLRAKQAGKEAVLRHRLLALRYGDNLKIREIAAKWDVEADRLHREYPKAREEFKRALMDVVRELQGGGPGAAQEVEAECARLLGLFS